MMDENSARVKNRALGEEIAGWRRETSLATASRHGARDDLCKPGARIECCLLKDLADAYSGYLQRRKV